MHTFPFQNQLNFAGKVQPQWNYCTKTSFGCFNSGLPIDSYSISILHRVLTGLLKTKWKEWICSSLETAARWFKARSQTHTIHTHNQVSLLSFRWGSTLWRVETWWLAAPRRGGYVTSRRTLGPWAHRAGWEPAVVGCTTGWRLAGLRGDTRYLAGRWGDCCSGSEIPTSWDVRPLEGEWL